MKTAADFLKQYAEQNPSICGNGQEIANRLYWMCVESSRMDNEKIDACYAALRQTADLPPCYYDEVLYIVSDLCLEHGRLAFMEGMKIGMLLMQELDH